VSGPVDEHPAAGSEASSASAVDDTGTLPPAVPVAADPPPPAAQAASPPAEVPPPPATEAVAAPPPPPRADPTPGEGGPPRAEEPVDGELEPPEGDEEDAEPGEEKRAGLLTKEVTLDLKTILAIVAVLALVAVGYGAYWLGQHQVESAGSPKTTTTTAFKLPKDFVTVDDAATGVKVAIPKDWVRYSTQGADPPLRMVAGIRDTDDSVSLRINAYSSEVTKDNVKDQQNVFDGVLAQQKDINVVVNQVVTVRGLPALFYVYSFKDQETGRTGIHAHYFVFQGRKMVSMIFQALPPDHPEDRYKALAPVFDQVINSLEVAPGAPPAFLDQVGGTTVPGAPGATTVAPSTTAPTTGPATTPTSR
jgi:hypothetical protein